MKSFMRCAVGCSVTGVLLVLLMASSTAIASGTEVDGEVVQASAVYALVDALNAGATDQAVGFLSDYSFMSNDAGERIGRTPR